MYVSWDEANDWQYLYYITKTRGTKQEGTKEVKGFGVGVGLFMVRKPYVDFSLERHRILGQRFSKNLSLEVPSLFVFYESKKRSKVALSGKEYKRL